MGWGKVDEEDVLVVGVFDIRVERWGGGGGCGWGGGEEEDNR